ncbi:MFS transporter [Thiocystis violacea]|uniref:MFS transporter n=1 Tax=Thiocystis violacea TaxID=13725 RepID=UPI00190424CB|nr:MFS transporter [Thiocystis violacea]MBK1716399.1 MFS transporter [Thiocystis violacea]
MTTDHPATRTSPTGLAIYLGVVQFFLLLTWTVYAIYLPGLLESVGIAKQWAGWVLLADQVLFALFDITAGFMADRAFRLYARIGPLVMAVTAVSCLAFLLLPWLPGLGARPEIFLAITALWVMSSAALRSPLFGLLARHAATPAVPRLAGLALVGLGLAAALSPYLGTLLKGQDPRLPFLIASLALMLVAAGVVLAERRGALAKPAVEEDAPARRLPVLGLMTAVLLAALAIQVAVFIQAGPRYLREVDAAWLPWLLPVFWVAFSLLAFVAGRFNRQWGTTRVFVIGAVVGALGLGLTSLPGLVAAIGGYALAGLGWGAALPSAFGLAAERGRPDRVATLTGVLFAVLAGAAFLRIGLNLSGWPTQPEWTSWILATPPIAWLLGGALMGFLIHRYLTRARSV